MIEFRKKKHEKYLQYKGYSAKKTHHKDESILPPICISETDINDNVASNDSEDFPWPTGTICIAGDSIVSGLQPGLPSQNLFWHQFWGHARQYKTNFTTQTRIHNFTRWH